MTQEELNERKQKILNAIVRDFQHSAEPVGSRVISKSYLPDYSPATIRNEMADLEEEGYIMQPHTSAGRIPTDQGYRFYVDRLMKVLHPTPREEELIRSTLMQTHNIDEILHQTAKLLSHTLDYTSIIINMSSSKRVYSAGTSHLIRQPEFRNLNNMQKILELLEEEEMLTELIHDYSDPDEVTITIGSENKHKAIKECSVVVSSYEIDHETAGYIGIIGPTRMYYSKATTIADYLAKELSKVLSTGEF
ncbi:MAG: hypothetical protein WC890_07365 [Candidatus Margulisiibacteriota bacterium]